MDGQAYLVDRPPGSRLCLSSDCLVLAAHGDTPTERAGLAWEVRSLLTVRHQIVVDFRGGLATKVREIRAQMWQQHTVVCASDLAGSRAPHAGSTKKEENEVVEGKRAIRTPPSESAYFTSCSQDGAALRLFHDHHVEQTLCRL